MTPVRRKALAAGLIAVLVALNLWRWLGRDTVVTATAEAVDVVDPSGLPVLALARDLEAEALRSSRDPFRSQAVTPPPAPPPAEPTETAEETPPDPLEVARQQAAAVMEELRLVGIVTADGKTIALIQQENRVHQVAVGDEPIVGYRVESIAGDELRMSQSSLGVTGVFSMTGDEPFRAVWDEK